MDQSFPYDLPSSNHVEASCTDFDFDQCCNVAHTPTQKKIEHGKSWNEIEIDRSLIFFLSKSKFEKIKNADPDVQAQVRRGRDNNRNAVGSGNRRLSIGTEAMLAMESGVDQQYLDPQPQQNQRKRQWWPWGSRGGQH